MLENNLNKSMRKKFTILTLSLLSATTKSLPSSDLSISYQSLHTIIMQHPDTPEVDSVITRFKKNINKPLLSFQPPMLPLHVATSYNAKQATLSLLKYGANIEAQDDEKYTALHHAAESASRNQTNCDIITILLEHNANFNATDAWGRKPIDLAKAKNKTTAVTILQTADEQSRRWSLERLAWITGAIRTSKQIDSIEDNFLGGAYQPSSAPTNTRDLFRIPATNITPITKPKTQNWSLDELD